MAEKTYKELLELGDNELIKNKDFAKAEDYYNQAMTSQPLGIDGINAMIVCKKLMKHKVEDSLL
jgi:hypothetical protein